MPLVSIIIATHNRAAFLRGAIESVLLQTFDDYEIIVVDDSSTDETPAVIASYPAVRGMRVQSGKPSRTRNAGIREARGKYVTFLDDDDTWLPHRLQAAVQVMESDAAIGMTYGQGQGTDIALNPHGALYPPAPLPDGHPIAAFMTVTLCLNAVMVRRDVIDDIGPFDETVYGAEDMDFTLRIARNYRCVPIEGAMSLVRFYPSISNTSERLWARWADQLRLMRHHFGIRDAYRPGPTARLRAMLKLRGWYNHLFLQRAVEKAEVQDKAETRLALRYACATSPFHSIKSPLFWKALGRAL